MAKRIKIMQKGLKLQCPACGAKEVTINLALDDMMCTCAECEDSFAPETARRMIGDELAKWEAMCEWLQMAGELLHPLQSDCDALPLPAPVEDDETEIVKVYA
jgi:transcription elongation factor Elf1